MLGASGEDAVDHAHDDDWLIRLDRRMLARLWPPQAKACGPAGWRATVARTLYLALRGSYLDRLPFQANALAFMTLLGLVPALAISFAVAKGFGFAETLERLLVQNDFLASQAEIFSQIIVYVKRTQVGTLGVVGLAVLLLTLLWTLSSVEETFNRVWEVPYQRTLLRRLTDYLSVLTICPILVVAATAIWAGVSSNALVRWLLDMAWLGHVGMGLGPFLLLAAAFVFIYLFLPNTHVPFWPALGAGVVTAFLWWGVQSLYIFFQVGVARYNAIYGGFASLPLFFVWVQVSWMVLLFGNQLARSYHVCRLDTVPGEAAAPLTPAQRQALALRLMYRVGQRFEEGRRAPSPAELAHELDLPHRRVRRALEALAQAGLLTQAGHGQGLMPARSLEAIKVGQVASAIAGPLTQVDLASPQPGEARLLALWAQAAQAGQEGLDAVSLAEFLRD